MLYGNSVARLAEATEYPYDSATGNRFDPAKDAVNREKHRLSLSFGDRLFEDDDHLVLPSLRVEDGEERFKVIGLVGEKLSPACSFGGMICLASFP